MHHVYTSPPFHPGQSDFPSPVGDPGISPLDLPASHRSLNAGSYAPLVIPVYPMARHITAVTSFTGHGVPSCAALVPARAESPFACNEALPCCSVMSKHHVRRHYSSFIAHMDSCAEPNPFLQLRVLLFRRIFAGCCLSPLGEGPSRRYLRNPYIGAWTPTPWCSSGALARFFPEDIGLTFGDRRSAHQTIPAMQLQQGADITGLQSFSYVQAPILARPPDCTYRYAPLRW
jgi:hypothetical protein